MKIKEFLQQKYPKTPKYDISFALERGLVSRGGQTLWNDDVTVKSGQSVQMAAVVYPTAKDVAAMIVFEDEHLMILNKPFNLASQPTADRGRINLVDLVRDFIWQRDQIVFEPGVVHRLDKDTSGLIIYLKDKALHKPIDKMFQNHRIQKTYWARVACAPQPASGTWVSELSEFPDPTTKKIIVRQASGFGLRDSGLIKFRQAKTRYKILAQEKNDVRLELQPQTGRMHQLRVQCAEAGCPILGDALYAPVEVRYYPLMFLHAVGLEFRHPATQQLLNCQAIPHHWNSL